MSDHDEQIAHLEDQVVRSLSVPPPIFGRERQEHTRTCIELRLMGIVKRCICPKEGS